MKGYIISIDQSTQGTKVLLLNERGRVCVRAYRPHRQLVNSIGWVEHDPEEIYSQMRKAVEQVIKESALPSQVIAAVGISNQRETAMAWERESGRPVYNAIVWQCARGDEICKKLKARGAGDEIRHKTGLMLSPYFSAAKFAWLIEHVPGVREGLLKGRICLGTMDSWLVFKLTGGKFFATDCSNASRTQLFDIRKMEWDKAISGSFGIPISALPQVMDSDGCFGCTDFEGLLGHKVPILGVMGDSQAALFGQGCLEKGQMKVTYGTGSSLMMNAGAEPVFHNSALVSSIGWRRQGKAVYVLEGNINYTGAVITWMKENLGLLKEAADSEMMAENASPDDGTYLVPAFSGLGAPYWKSDVRAMFCGMSRTTGRKELVRAGLESIAYQIGEVEEIMREAAGSREMILRADGGPSKNQWLMQFQSDILNRELHAAKAEELSALGAGFMAGIRSGLFGEDISSAVERVVYRPSMVREERLRKLKGWKQAVAMVTGIEYEGNV